jgi:hypothetical protein
VSSYGIPRKLSGGKKMLLFYRTEKLRTIHKMTLYFHRKGFSHVTPDLLKRECLPIAMRALDFKSQHGWESFASQSSYEMNEAVCKEIERRIHSKIEEDKRKMDLLTYLGFGEVCYR